MFVDKLTKMVRMAPTTSDVDAVGAARLFIAHVFRHHGMCTTLVTDRGTQFTSRFFRTLMTELDCQQALSTAHHPQTDGQTERMNRILEDTLRHYVGPQQDQYYRVMGRLGSLESTQELSPIAIASGNSYASFVLSRSGKQYP